MAILLHETTRLRAERIVQIGPDPNFMEPGGFQACAFSTCLESGPFLLGTPADYARGKALLPDEGGPVILAIEVPDEIIVLAVDPLFPLSQGIVQFDLGDGLEQLQAAWSSLQVEIREA